MKRKTYPNTTLNVVLQHLEELPLGTCLNGIISIDEKAQAFRFEESCRKGRGPRNPKLYDGEYISMVRMQNGKYQCHLKTFNPTPDMNRQAMAFKVYSELMQALQIFD